MRVILDTNVLLSALLAVASEAEFLATGDKHLLAVKQHGATHIVTPVIMVQHL